MARSWREDLLGAVRDSEFDVVGEGSVRDEPTARCASALLKGQRKATGLLYFEAVPRRGGVRPPDLLLARDGLGVLTIEVKGFGIDKITRVANGTFFVSYKGTTRQRDVVQQARQAMFDARDAISREFDRDGPFNDYIVALPRVREAEWEQAGYADALPREDLILADDLEAPKALVDRLLARAGSRSRKLRGRSASLSGDEVLKIRHAFGDTAVIEDRRPWRRVDALSLGGTIDEMATAEKSLSIEQQDLSRIEIDGRPRIIRGVAGSGKSVVLANIVARTVCRVQTSSDETLFSEAAESPRIAAVCFNRSLVPFLQRKIRRAYVSFAGEDLDYPELTVTHVNSLIYSLCEQRGGPLQYIPVREGTEEERAESYLAQLDGIDPEWLDTFLFDAIFIDEAQDLTESELRLMRRLVRPAPGTQEVNLVVFYDDAQNVYGRPRPVWKDVGIQAVGRTHMMKECFRNSRQIVEFAFNLLLGSAAEPGEQVQTRSFADVADLKKRELVVEEDGVFRVRFTDRQDGDTPEVQKFENRGDEWDWVSLEIKRLVDEESVRPEDVLILSEGHEILDDLVSHLKRSELPVRGYVQPHKDGEKDAYIMRRDHLTVTTTRSAKGYDAHVVLVVGADAFSRENTGRASFYVGCTRARLRLVVTGVGGRGLIDEAARFAGPWTP
jgi:Schlafen group 3, DNA/RNA helicase domain